MKPWTFFLLAVLLVLPASLRGAATPAGAATLIEWTFDRPSDLRGWQPNGHLTGVTVSNGVLACRAIGSDPILELRPLINLKTSPWQQIEIRLKADHDGRAEIFWSNVSTGRYGGFTQDKTTDFNVTGDSQWHTYRLLPFWHPEGKIVRLRFDPYDGTKFELASFRITELATRPPVEKAAFDFTNDAQGWQAVGEAQLATHPLGLRVATPKPDSFALGPPLRVPADEQNYVSLRMAVDQGAHGTLFFATDAKHGLRSFAFPIEADGQEHTYNLDLIGASDWHGRVVALGLRPSDAAGAQARLRWLKVSDTPQGPAQLKLVSFTLEEALPRAGVPATLTAAVANTGGESASNLQVNLRLPDGVNVLNVSPAENRMAALGFGEEAAWRWKLQSEKPLQGEALLSLSATGAEPLTARAPLEFTPRLAVARTGYVPEPKPVRGPMEVGAYYFPGWNSASRWQPLQHFPERKPVLGWYREGDPEVADWQIKWAVEHGITFFAYDWYWSQGARHLEHGLHDGYFKARYRSLLKFCLLWANHNPAHTSTPEDCLAVTRYWIENYFRRPEYLTVDGKPVMIIFSAHRLTEDLESAGVKKAFEAMRIECQRAGLKGLHLIACVGDAGGARHAAAEGYDAVTAYNWPGLGMTGEGKRAPFATLVPAYLARWEHIIAQSPIPLSPLPICGGWDSRPWHGENNLIRFGRTPEQFKRHLLDAKTLLASRPAPPAPRPMILVEAWNEWGEGSYIEPHQEFGFGYLDAIREVFTDAPKVHADVTPADAGLGPYDVPPAPPAKTAWNFARADDGWNNTMGLAGVAAHDGALSGRTTNHDPAFFSPGLQARADKFTTVVIRMKLQREDGQPLRDEAQLFWSTSRLPESESTSERFAVTGDGQWHEYTVPVSQNHRWRGVITRLRLDPVNQPGVRVELDSIRLQ